MSESLIWLTAELEAGLEKFIEDRDVAPNPRLTRDEALQTIVRDWLQGQGFVPLPDGDRVVPVAQASRVPTDD